MLDENSDAAIIFCAVLQDQHLRPLGHAFAANPEDASFRVVQWQAIVIPSSAGYGSTQLDVISSTITSGPAEAPASAGILGHLIGKT